MAIPSRKRVAAHSHWPWGSSLININGGHFEGYIRKTGPGSVPRMYVARNKRLEGQSSSPSTGQQKTAGQTSNYKPRFHKTTAFAAKVEESEARMDQCREAQLTEEGNPSEADSSLDDDDGLYIPSYLEEVAPDNPVLQVRLARAMRVLEKETRRCYKCHQQGHLQKDCKEPDEKNGLGPLSSKGPLSAKPAQDKTKLRIPQPGRAAPPANPPK